MLNRIKNFISGIFQSRVAVLGIFFAVLFALLIQKAFSLQIVHGEDYLESFTYRIQKETELPSARGAIYDRNGKLLAYNRLAYDVIIEDTSVLEDNASENAMIAHLIDLVESSGYVTVNNLPIELYDDGTMEFTASGNTLLRFIRDVYGLNSIDELSEEQKSVTAEELFGYMCHGDATTSMFGIDETYSAEEALKIAAIRYELYMKRYEQYLSVTIVSDVSDALVAKVKENAAELPGVSIYEDYVRQYEDSKYFSNITGYCGEISQEELAAYEEAGNDTYSSGDIIGKTGIEQRFEEQLHGTKGSETVYVDSLGSVLEVAERTESTPGDNLYLSIDKDYQMKGYDLLEEEIAGLLLEHLGKEDGDPEKIYMQDVYAALIDNGIIDLEHFQERDATELEQSMHDRYLSVVDARVDQARALLNGSNSKTYNAVTDEEREYIDLIENIIESESILDTSKLSSADDVMSRWSVGTASLYEYLHYAIGKGAVNMDALEIDSKYLDSSQIYDAMTEYIVMELEGSHSFKKIVYHYMLEDGTINGTQICLLLYDQGILEEDDAYERLQAGTLGSYDFMIEKITKLEITPDMLALDPCSGSLVVTDPNNGEVLALVSYPSYDANRIQESAYYASLLENASLPLYNRATMQRTAPGSTFKMITAAAGLEEGVISTDTYIMDQVTFEKVEPHANCWSKVGHGSIEVTDAIKESCNYFFYEVGYRLGITENGTYSSEYGISRLQEYMRMFGLDRTSGIELEEIEPNMSDTDSVLSSIGQARNSYAPSQIARYITAVASKGDLYSLSILDKLTDPNGNLIEDYTPELLDHIEFKKSTWDAIFEGMYKVIGNGSFYPIFSDLDLEVAGKSGTAQEDMSRPDHGLFVSFAPYDDPQVTVTVVLPFGYGSSNSGSVAKHMLSYIFHQEEAGTGERTAAEVSGITIQD